MIRRFFITLLAALLLTPAYADETGAPPEPPHKNATCFEKIKKDEPLKIALSKETPPFCSVVGGKPAGFDVEIAHLLAKALNAKIEFVFPKTDEQTALLASGKSDLIIAGFTVSIERARQINFSKPYLEFSQAAILDKRFIPRVISEGRIYKEPLESYLDLNKIKGLVVGYKAGTRVEEMAHEKLTPASFKSFADIQTATTALQNGEIDTLVHDAPVIQFMYEFNDDMKKRFALLDKPCTSERMAIGIRKGEQDLKNFLDVFITELQSQGVIDDLKQKYFKNTAWAKGDAK